jgi:hypothetical protein
MQVERKACKMQIKENKSDGEKLFDCVNDNYDNPVSIICNYDNPVSIICAIPITLLNGSFADMVCGYN